MDHAEEIRRFFAAAAPDLLGPDLDAFIAAGKTLTLEAGAFFCAPATRDHRLGFIHRGVIRYHVLTDAGDDVTKDFSLPNSFAVSFGGAVRHSPSPVALSAVGECVLTVWPYGQVERQYASSAKWERFGRRVAESLYVRKESRELSLLLRSASERYAEARETFGPALGEIPQYQLASYLGITPETLSRLRRSATKQGKSKRAR